MARTRNGRFGKAVNERVDVGAVLRKGAHDKRLHTSELAQTDDRDGSQRSLDKRNRAKLLVQTLVIERACLYYINPFLL